jgi:hypothetical protein
MSAGRSCRDLPRQEDEGAGEGGAEQLWAEDRQPRGHPSELGCAPTGERRAAGGRRTRRPTATRPPAPSAWPRARQRRLGAEPARECQRAVRGAGEPTAPRGPWREQAEGTGRQWAPPERQPNDPERGPRNWACAPECRQICTENESQGRSLLGAIRRALAAQRCLWCLAKVTPVEVSKTAS